MVKKKKKKSKKAKPVETTPVAKKKTGRKQTKADLIRLGRNFGEEL